MSGPEIWLSVALITLATLITRAGLLFVNSAIEPGPRLTTALRYAPGCALAAVVFPDLLVEHGHSAISLLNPRLLAVFVGVAIYAATRGTLRTIAGGMLAFWLLRYLLG
jgi:branched-subunit amino acid transport protein